MIPEADGAVGARDHHHRTISGEAEIGDHLPAPELLGLAGLRVDQDDASGGPDGEPLGHWVEGDEPHVVGAGVELADELAGRVIGRQRAVESGNVEAAIERRVHG